MQFLLNVNASGGKTTFLNNHYQDCLSFDLLDPERMRFFSARPERLKEIVAAQPGSKTIVIDEMQKVPELLPVVHGLIEMKKGWKFILTGSSARKLKRKGVDMLGGRALLCSLHPFMAAELEANFNLENALRFGLLPVTASSEIPDQVLYSYAALYLREEVQMEGLMRNIGSFSRFLEAISFSHSSLLNNSNVAQECGEDA
jgi:uncharacterized protein